MRKPALKYVKQVVLPSKPSTLLEIAMADLESAEKSKNYTIDMWSYHETLGSKCAVCLAGSVMAFSLKADKNTDLSPENFGINQQQLIAIDHLRMGDFSYVAEALDLDYKQSVVQKYNLERNITSYEKDPTLFKKEIKEYIRDLKKAGF